MKFFLGVFLLGLIMNGITAEHQEQFNQPEMTRNFSLTSGFLENICSKIIIIFYEVKASIKKVILKVGLSEPETEAQDLSNVLKYNAKTKENSLMKSRACFYFRTCQLK